MEALLIMTLGVGRLAVIAWHQLAALYVPCFWLTMWCFFDIYLNAA